MIIGVPCISRPDMLARFLRSVDTDWPLVVIDNSSGTEIAEACEPFDVTLVMPPSNLGVAASWNFLIRTHPAEDWWCIANADTELAPGDLERLARAMVGDEPRWLGMNGDWRVMGLNRACVEIVGFFDENYHPIYCEDADYERRCTLAGVEWGFIDGGATHAGSATIQERRYGEANARTYPQNVDYYRRKWGGHLRGGETYSTPFNRGGSVRDWTLDLSRLRAQAW